MLKIICDDIDLSALSNAFSGEYEADCDLSLEVVTVPAEKIRELNAQSRGVDAVTDVLSFPALDGIRGKEIKKRDFPFDWDEDGNLFIGSIAVCRERAAEQAEEYGHSFERELNYLITHGIFHLLGYDHMTDEDKREMRQKEESVMKKLNLSRDGQ